MNSTAKTFRSHLFSKIYQYILKDDYLHFYIQSDEGYGFDTDEFYATAIPELFRSLKDNYEVDKHYRSVIGQIPPDERPAIQDFMGWFNMHQNDGFRKIFSALTHDDAGYNLDPLYRLIEVVKKSQFEHVETAQTEDEGLQHIFNVIDRFTSAAKSVLKRRLNKPILALDDEYDMQDLLFVMLRAYFPSVKSEQVTDGNADRLFLKIDFLLPDSKIAIE